MLVAVNKNKKKQTQQLVNGPTYLNPIFGYGLRHSIRNRSCIAASTNALRSDIGFGSKHNKDNFTIIIPSQKIYINMKTMELNLTRKENWFIVIKCGCTLK